jgi:hypothetical protein
VGVPLIEFDKKQLSVHLGFYLDEVGTNAVLEDLSRRVTAIADTAGQPDADPELVRQAVRVAAKLRVLAAIIHSSS